MAEPQTDQPVAYPATHTLLGVPVTVYLLANGQRAISVDSLAALVAVLAPEQPPERQQDVQAFGRWLRSLPPPTEG